MALDVQTTISAHERDTTTANSSATASAVTGEVADLRVTVSASPTSLTRGASVTYTVQVTNAGPIESSSSVLTLTPGNGLSLGASPSGCTAGTGATTCNVGALANGASRSFQFPATAPGAGSLTVTASIAGAATAADPNSTNNTVTAAITSTDPPPPPTGGGSGGGGGGSMEWMTLLALSLLFARKTRRSRRV
jgi:subtilase family serine protease